MSSSTMYIDYTTRNVGIGTMNPTSKFTLDSGTNNVSGLKFNRISSSSTAYSGATL